jgi:hypothetical protein
MSNPSHVRIADPNAVSLRVDILSGWSISGWDIKEFPDGQLAGNFVRRNLNQGVLEPATSEEFGLAHPPAPEENDAEAFVKAVQAASVNPVRQEAHIQANIEADADKLRSLRHTQTDEKGDTPDMVRRKELIEIQESNDGGDTEVAVTQGATGDPKRPVGSDTKGKPNK